MNLRKSESLAELVGVCFGDGSLTRKGNSYRLQIRGHITEDRDHYKMFVIPLLNDLTLPLLGKKVSTVESRKSYRSFGIAIQSKHLGEFLKSLGIPVGKKLELAVPIWIKMNKLYSIAFLRGLFDTDGTVFCKKNYSLKNVEKHTQIKLKIVTTSITLANHVQELLLSLNLKHYLKIQIKKKMNERTAYHVEISGGINVDKWFELVGSNNPKHQTKYLVWKKFGFCPPYSTLEQRKRFLSGSLNPEKYYAGVPEI